MNPLISSPMMGVLFISKEKIKIPAKTTTIIQKEAPKLIHIECSLVQTPRLGKMEGIQELWIFYENENMRI